jgi:hypothetical protein
MNDRLGFDLLKTNFKVWKTNQSITKDKFHVEAIIKPYLLIKNWNLQKFEAKIFSSN